MTTKIIFFPAVDFSSARDKWFITIVITTEGYNEVLLFLLENFTQGHFLHNLLIFYQNIMKMNVYVATKAHSFWLN